MTTIRGTPESAVVKACLAVLGALGAFAWRANTGAMMGEYRGKRRFVRFGPTGQSDIIGVMPDGRFIAVECKAPSRLSTVSADQREFQLSVKDRKGIAFAVDSADMLADLIHAEGYQ